MKPFVPVIKIIGVGGGGNNALNNMVEAGLHGVEFIGVNTDAQALSGCRAGTLIPIGGEMTHGLGAGNDPDIGRRAAEQAAKEIAQAVEGADLVFVTAGKGGGTGTGAAPVVASIAKKAGCLTVGVVTRPFAFEGKRRCDQADRGIGLLQEEVDTLIIVPNDRLLDVADDMPVVEAFRMADDVLRQGVQGVTELITEQGLINVDFADIRETLRGSGNALIGIGHATGDDRARQAALNATDSPLLESSIDGARRVLLNISGGSDLGLFEATEAAEVIASAVDPEASIVFGAVIDERLANHIKVTVIASGFRQPAEVGRDQATSSKGPARAGGEGGRRQEPIDVPTFMNAPRRRPG
jgi:cell division protein FtsZ